MKIGLLEIDTHAHYPFVEVQDYTGERVEGNNVVEFRLLYSGLLLGASRETPRAEMKHAIRRRFHPQLRRLWRTHYALSDMARLHGGTVWNKSERRTEEQSKATDEMLVDLGVRSISEDWGNRFGYNFVPLVTKELCLRCSLDILLLRPEEPHLVIHSGDMDAKLKTLFDALRMPDNLKETAGETPQADEDPFFVLLQDDKLIADIRIVTDQLLLLPEEREVKANDAFAVITVKLQPIGRSEYGWVFE